MAIKFHKCHLFCYQTKKLCLGDLLKFDGSVQVRARGGLGPTQLSVGELMGPTQFSVGELMGPRQFSVGGLSRDSREGYGDIAL